MLPIIRGWSLNNGADLIKYHSLGTVGIYLALIMLFSICTNLEFYFILCPVLLHLNVSVESATIIPF